MDEVTNRLVKTKLFSGLTQTEVEAITPLIGGQQRSCPKGTVLAKTDMPVGFVGIVLSGTLNTYKEDIDGRLNLIRKTGAYEMFGVDIASTPTQVSPLIILCATDADVLTFPYSLIASPGPVPDRFRCVMLKNILELTSNQSMRQLYKIDILSRKSLRARIMLYLTLQAKRKKTNELILAYNREELADYLCVDRSALSRELGRMQKAGLIEFDRNHFSILSDTAD